MDTITAMVMEKIYKIPEDKLVQHLIDHQNMLLNQLEAGYQDKSAFPCESSQTVRVGLIAELLNSRRPGREATTRTWRRTAAHAYAATSSFLKALTRHSGPPDPPTGATACGI
jgi:hypothetical protein